MNRLYRKPSVASMMGVIIGFSVCSIFSVGVLNFMIISSYPR